MLIKGLLGLAVAAGMVGVALAQPTPSACGSITFIGKLRWTKRYPQDSYARVTKQRNGSQLVETTNSCGKADSSFQVEKPLGGPRLASLVVRSTLDETCKPPVPMTAAAVLVQARREHGRWILDSVQPIVRDLAGRAIVLPRNAHSMLGIPLKGLLKKLPKPIFATTVEDRGSNVKRLEERGILKRRGKDLYYVSAVYVTDLQRTFQKDPKMSGAGCQMPKSSAPGASE